MKKEIKCPICRKRIYSGIGKGCKMCGMILENQEEDYCCGICMRKYNTIKRKINLKTNQK